RARRGGPAAAAPPAPLVGGGGGAGGGAAGARGGGGGPAPDGSDWPARHPEYVNPFPPLNREGGLVDSLATQASADSAEWGSNLVYARPHQLGATIEPRNAEALQFMLGEETVTAKSVTIPARPYAGWGEDEVRMAEDVVEAWLDQHLGGRA
ncbi:MAG: phage virion morphogenesis protein, partial [Rhodospirillaceae bacterium]|nr:phage virion morphogenesis protein [Rhodospirillaceae bacterium]